MDSVEEKKTGSERGVGRTGVLIVVLGVFLSAALVAAGLTFAVNAGDSSDKGDESGSAAGEGAGSMRDKNVAFAECLRKNGVPDYPDPDKAGTLRLEPGSKVNIDGAAYKNAERVCMKDAPPAGQRQGAPPAGAGEPRRPDPAKYVECMRKNGMPKFPKPDNRGMFTGVDLDSPEYKTAQKACEKLLPGPPPPS
ncbi:hypothetical protein G5C51_23100 [Streptomyces sp. A7024]|uniref:Uncharacterized protein n=1 Tax=Streptomyces coryli TaxID=1128680 RepID=A0A6G4U3E4_9ACTN|nr:hypothetical protein [Streptomyces coryli]NGN66779.1 hypothetical protein [Streptomyces coryli]